MTAVEKRVKRNFKNGIEISDNVGFAKRVLNELESFTVKRVIDGDVAYMEKSNRKNKLVLKLAALVEKMESYLLERDGNNINHIIKFNNSRKWILIEEAGKENLADQLVGDTE